MADPKIPQLVAQVATDQPLEKQQPSSANQAPPPLPEGYEFSESTPPLPSGYEFSDNKPSKPEVSAKAAQPTQFENERKYASDPLSSFNMKNLGESAWQGAKGAAKGVYDVGKDLATNPDWVMDSRDDKGNVTNKSTLEKFAFDPADAEAGKAKAEWKAGNKIQAAGHGLAAIVPFAGPWAAHLGERAGQGDIGGATAEGAGTAATMKGFGEVAKPLVKPAIEGAGTAIKEGVKSFSPNTDLPVMRNLGDILRSDKTYRYKQPAFDPYGKSSVEATKKAVTEGRASKVPTTLKPLEAPAPLGSIGDLTDQAIVEKRANAIPTKIKPEPIVPEKSPLDQAIEEGRANALPTKVKTEPAQAIAEGRASKVPTTLKAPKKASPLGTIETPEEEEAAPDKPITPAEVKSSPGTSMSDEAKTELNKMLGEEPEAGAAPVANEPAPEPPSTSGTTSKPPLTESVERDDKLNQAEYAGKVAKGRAMKEHAAKQAAAKAKPTFDSTAEKLQTQAEAEKLDRGAGATRKKELPRVDGERRAVERTPEEKEVQDLFGQARKELGDDASSDDVVKKVAELKRDKVSALEPKVAPTKFTDRERSALKTLGLTDEEIDAISQRETSQSGETTPEDFVPKVEEQVALLPNEELKKLATAHGIDTSKYDFSKRVPEREGGTRHPVERKKLVKDLMEKIPDDEKTNIGQNIANSEREPEWAKRDQSNKAKAERAKTFFPRLREKAEGTAAGAEGKEPEGK